MVEMDSKQNLYLDLDLDLPAGNSNMNPNDASQELERLGDDALSALTVDTAMGLCERLQVADNGFEGLPDIIERLRLLKRKQKHCGYKPFPQFSRVQADAATKRRNLLEILMNIRDAFSRIPTEPLSDVLWQEKLLTKPDLLDELDERMRSLHAKETIIIVAGETNSGKSSFLNVLLGQNILPTDVLHCTYVVCKIVYSFSFSVETLDYGGYIEEHQCSNCEEARNKLKEIVTCDNLKRRQKSSHFKEITLKMPADILKSGITLVDTPGIGENEAMDGVTINFVRETQASAFIYIIKSDGAGGVQEDRLLAFLRAVKENYNQDRLEGTFDPQAAMFVCHRWDCINPSETEKVKRNALRQIETVWPGFQPSQTFLFSSTKTQLHLDADPEFITDSFNTLLIGLKDLVDRATHNAIKYQYCWAKFFLQPACRHLRSMITHCNANNEALEEHFQEVAEKQECLMKESTERVPMLNKQFDDQKRSLRLRILSILDLSDISISAALVDYNDLLSQCSEDKFLQSRDNRKKLDQQIIASLVSYCDDYLMKEEILKKIEESLLQVIKKHLGLFEHQMIQIKSDMRGRTLMRDADFKETDSLTSSTSSLNKFALGRSYGSNLSMSSDPDEYETSTIPDPIVLNQEVSSFLERQMSRGPIKKILRSGQKFGRKIIEKIGDTGRAANNPKQYLEAQIKKMATGICADQDVIDSFVNRYLSFSQRCVNHAINCIPQFIAVNTQLMNKIREHREDFLKDKQEMKDVMEILEPNRSQLQGYGSLHMVDVNADQINFMVERKSSIIQLEQDLNLSTNRNDDSGFIDSGSNRSRVRRNRLSVSVILQGVLQKTSFWAYMRNAKLCVDDALEDVTIKAYTFTMNDADQYSEIASLRCLEHENIAPFYGMTRIDTKDEASATTIPSFIFKGQLCSANVYKKLKFIDMQTFVPSFLIGLWSGLNFIHKEHLVHLELNLDTVMIESRTGIVKLCQHCKPREAQLPSDLSVETKSAVCLSPAALYGNIYDMSDDIYAFGLLLWELLFPDDPPYKEERKWPLQKFIEEVHPTKMLRSELENLKASSAVKSVLDGCLTCRQVTVITMSDIFSFIENIDQDPAVIALKNRRSMPPIRRLEGRSQHPDYGESRKDHLEEMSRTPSFEDASQSSRSLSPYRDMTDRSGTRSPICLSIPEETMHSVQTDTLDTPIPPPRPRRNSARARRSQANSSGFPELNPLALDEKRLPFSDTPEIGMSMPASTQATPWNDIELQGKDSFPTIDSKSTPGGIPGLVIHPSPEEEPELCHFERKPSYKPRLSLDNIYQSLQRKSPDLFVEQLTNAYRSPLQQRKKITRDRSPSLRDVRLSPVSHIKEDLLSPEEAEHSPLISRQRRRSLNVSPLRFKELNETSSNSLGKISPSTEGNRLTHNYSSASLEHASSSDYFARKRSPARNQLRRNSAILDSTPFDSHNNALSEIMQSSDRGAAPNVERSRDRRIRSRPGSPKINRQNSPPKTDVVETTSDSQFSKSFKKKTSHGESIRIKNERELDSFSGSVTSGKMYYFENLNASRNASSTQYSVEKNSDSANGHCTSFLDMSLSAFPSANPDGLNFSQDAAHPSVTPMDNEESTYKYRSSYMGDSNANPSDLMPAVDDDANMFLSIRNGDAFPALPDIDMVAKAFPTLPSISRDDNTACDDFNMDDLPADLEIEGLSFLTVDN